MAEVSVLINQRFKTTTCIACGCAIAMVSDQYDHRLRDHADFYCPNGHAQRFISEPEEVRLRRELEAAKAKLALEQHTRRAAEGQLQKERASKARLKKRVGAGVCPCCHRTFKQLADHMKAKHPDMAAGRGERE